MGSNTLLRSMSSKRRMIVLVIFSLLILVDANPSISEYLTKDTEARRTCYFDPDNCYSYETCCTDGRCVDSDVGCYADCSDDFLSFCDYSQICCYVDDGWRCKDSDSECIDGALWGIGIAAAIASIVGPIVCCCCCGGCALYWLIKTSRERRAHANQPGVHMMQPQYMMQPPQMMQAQQPGMQMMQGVQVQPQGYPTGGFVAQPPGYEQGNQAGEMYPSVPDPENVR